MKINFFIIFGVLYIAFIAMSSAAGARVPPPKPKPPPPRAPPPPPRVPPARPISPGAPKFPDRLIQ